MATQFHAQSHLHREDPNADHPVAVAVVDNSRANVTESALVSWSDFRNAGLSKHFEQAQKDGVGDIFANLRGGRRDENVESVSCLPYDIDGKLTVAQVSCAVSASAIEAVLYTTYNHLKTQTTVGAKSFRAWANANGYDEKPTDTSMKAFCAANHKYAHLINVRVGNGGETVRVKMYDNEFDAFLIEHDPEHKTRVIIPLRHAVPLKEVGKDVYKAIYHAIGQQLFGDSYDTACSNPARLNYAPSRPRGSMGHIIEHHGGTLLDWKPAYESLKDDIGKRREDSARRRAEWTNSSPRDLAELHHVLKSIPSYIPRDQWFSALAAIFHETRGSEDGRQLAHSWSERDDDRYDFDEVETIWDGFDLDHPKPATMGTLIALARNHDPDFTLCSASTSFARVAKFLEAAK